MGLLSSGNLLANRDRDEFNNRDNVERSHTQQHQNQGARDAAAMGAAHRSGEQSGVNQSEQSNPQYIEVPQGNTQPSNSTQIPQNAPNP